MYVGVLGDAPSAQNTQSAPKHAEVQGVGNALNNNVCQCVTEKDCGKVRQNVMCSMWDKGKGECDITCNYIMRTCSLDMLSMEGDGHGD